MEKTSHKAAKGKTLKVMSYNVNFGLYYGTMEAPSSGAYEVLKVIEQEDSDIVLMQETTDKWEQLMCSQLENMYPYTMFHHSEYWFAGGMGILSKHPFEEIGWFPPKSQWFHGWIIQSDTPIGKVQFLNLHLRPPMGANAAVPWPGEFIKSKNQRLNDLLHWYPNLNPDLPTIVLGDFNESHSGLYSGKACVWLEKNGYIDAIKQFDPNTNTWEWPLYLITLRAQFDHIFYDKTNLICTDAKVVVGGASDHFPIVATLSTNEIEKPKKKLSSFSSE